MVRSAGTQVATFHITGYAAAGNLINCRCSTQENAATRCRSDTLSEFGWDPRIIASVISGAMNATSRAAAGQGDATLLYEPNPRKVNDQLIAQFSSVREILSREKIDN